MDVNPISMKRIYQSVIEQFIGLIKDGKLNIGQKLPPERTLAEMFNVSRASIREAFRAMEIIGIIDVRPGGGTYISNLNIAPFINIIAPLFLKNENMEKELLEFRKLIELEAVKLAAQKHTEGKALQLDKPLEVMKLSIVQDDITLGAEADISFHKAIFSLSDNLILIKAAECVAFILESSVKFNRAKILRDSDNSRELLDQHIGICEAIRQKDPALAYDRMQKHLNYVQEFLDK